MTRLLRVLAWLGAATWLAAGPVICPLRAAENNGAEGAAIAISTGAPVGVYYAAGNAMCRLVLRDELQGSKQGFPCAASASAGSAANIELLRQGKVGFATVQSDVLKNAYEGTGPYQGHPFEKLRSVFSLHGEPFQLLVGRNSGVTSFLDLKGKKVNMEKAGTAQNRIFSELLHVHGLDESWLGRTVNVSITDQFQSLCDEDIDALGVMIGFPNNGYTAVIRRCGARLADVDTVPVRNMLGAASPYARIVIPKGTYPDMERDVVTFGVLAVVAATADTPDDEVRAVLKAVFGHLDDLRAMHRSFAALDPQRMTHDAIAAPLHPAAARYYRDLGLLDEVPR